MKFGSLTLETQSHFPQIPLTFLSLWKIYTSLVVVQSINRVQLFVTPRTGARQASLSFTISWSLLRLNVHWVRDAIEPSHPLLPPSPCALNLSQHQDLFQRLAVRIKWPKYWSFSIRPSSEYSELISFRIVWFDLPAAEGTLKSLLQHHSLKGSILWCWASFMVQLSHLYMTTGKTIALTIWTFVGQVMSVLTPPRSE